MKKYIGAVDHVTAKCAFIIPEGARAKERDIMVLAKNLKGALHQDKVEVIVTDYNGKGPIGNVRRIVERAHTSIVGRIVKEGGRIYCMPDHKRFYPMLIPRGYTKHAAVNDKVVVTDIEWLPREEKHVGKVAKILGSSGTYQAELGAIFMQFGLQEAFDPKIEKMVAAIPSTLSKEEMAGRRDFTKVNTCTIDPVDAKDFDDALSVQVLANGDYEIGIHIADVTHYVKANSELDKVAFQRSTSVYLVEHVVPMLPERLSNDLCSLRPKEIRPALGIVVKLSPEAVVKDVWIGETLIYSDKRFTYQEAYDIIEQKEGLFYKELDILHGLAQKLRKKRLQKGAIAFETTDVKIKLNKAKVVVDIVPKKNLYTHELIEEFMLLANRTVATKMTAYYKQKKVKNGPFLYRIHDTPNPEKIASFATFVRQLGYKFSTDTQKLPASFNHVLTKSKGSPHESMIQTLAIRTMEQAHYTTQPNGHFGLGFTYYGHVTSPIRRYPDLVTHRLIKDYLACRAPAKQPYDAIARHCSEKERVAVEAERSSISYHQVHFMKRQEGKRLEGVISGVTEWGVYVAIIENKCEGMIRLADLQAHYRDFYVFEPARFRLISKNTKQTFQIGDPIRVFVKECNVYRKQITFLPAQ
ncbi:MAG: ribonuclease R [Bacteroidota bacterium]